MLRCRRLRPGPGRWPVQAASCDGPLSRREWNRRAPTFPPSLNCALGRDPRQCHGSCTWDDRSKPRANYTTVTPHLYYDHHCQAWSGEEQVKYQNWRLKTGDARPKQSLGVLVLVAAWRGVFLRPFLVHLREYGVVVKGVRWQRTTSRARLAPSWPTRTPPYWGPGHGSPGCFP
jgi:hypothetical protein